MKAIHFSHREQIQWSPIADRFRLVLHLDYYSHDELTEIVR